MSDASPIGLELELEYVGVTDILLPMCGPGLVRSASSSRYVTGSDVEYCWEEMNMDVLHSA